ncbi:MAG: DNA (cytosine-5-)-methyltransferase [Lachnospiraceae bacterium]|nr:DNA (cytosine-5-)-methyltransferase [Lachnospiraceae bacterium]
MPNYLDLFAGAGGLSEGFIQTGYNPIVHVEMDEAACFTLKTRSAYHWLKANSKINIYEKYISGEMSRAELYKTVPDTVLNAVMNYEISEETIPEIFARVDTILGRNNLDLIVGGPPCQAYSLVGRARSENGMIGDKRNYLYKLYAEFLKRYKPKYFVFENVTGLLSAKDKDETLHFDNMRALFKECGYSTEYRVLKATDYGVLQNRKRIILIGKRGKDEKNFYPELPTVNTEGVTVSEIFKDLPPLHAGEGSYRPVKALEYKGTYLYDMGIKDTDLISFHSARPHTDQDLEIYRLVVDTWNKEGKRIDYPDFPEKLRTHHNMTAFLDRFKVVAGNLPYSQTVVAHVSRDGHYYIHPDIKQNRSLTPREVARLQTFPDSYYFESRKDIPGRTAAYRQIGNAVPVRLAYTVAAALKDKLE